MDCDEVPSLDVIRACTDFVASGGDGVAGFERHQVLWRDDRLWTATTARFTPTAQRQWRLFNRERVTFLDQIHTPGIRVEEPVPMSPDASLYHLSWIFLSWEDRLMKAARYDRHGQPSPNRANQLFPVADAEWRALDMPVLFTALARWAALEAQAASPVPGW